MHDRRSLLCAFAGRRRAWKLERNTLVKWRQGEVGEKYFYNFCLLLCLTDRSSPRPFLPRLPLRLRALREKCEILVCLLFFRVILMTFCLGRRLHHDLPSIVAREKCFCTPSRDLSSLVRLIYGSRPGWTRQFIKPKETDNIPRGPAKRNGIRTF